MVISASSIENSLSRQPRVESIDVLRGIILMLMALDHCRDFFHLYAFQYSPEDLNFTTPLVFFTRWITHFCAPAFIVLTGISAYLYQHKNSLTHKELASYLLIRGAILIVLEITVVRFGWRFHIDYSSIGGLVLWAIGWSMIALAALSYLPKKILFALGIFILIGHNMLDSFYVQDNKTLQLIWAFLHENSFVSLSENFGVRILYPVLPIIGIIAVGFSIGSLFTQEYSGAIRSGYLFYFGLILTMLFLSMRFFQFAAEQYAYVFYLTPEDLEHKWVIFFKKITLHVVEHFGDPSPWAVQENLTYTILSFLSTTKYPMSLFYTLMTLGPVLMILSYFEGKRTWFTKLTMIFGKVPLFFYVIHLYLIHGLAILVVAISYPDSIRTITQADWTKLSMNYGVSMPLVYLIWIGVLILLYPMCLFYGRFRAKSKSKLASIL